MNEKYIQGMEHAYSLISQANSEMIDLWVQNVLWSWRWWIGVILAIVPWVMWLVFRKKESSNRLLYAGLFIMLISSWLDIEGILFSSWSYYYKIIPSSPAFIPWDFSLLPVTAMFFLQFKPNIHKVYKAIIFSSLSSFVAEPIFEMLNLYNPKQWKFIYSLPIVFVIYLMTDWFSKRPYFNNLQESVKKD